MATIKFVNRYIVTFGSLYIPVVVNTHKLLLMLLLLLLLYDDDDDDDGASSMMLSRKYHI